MSNDVCSICGDEALFQTNTSSPTCHRLACGHPFHVDCIVQWFAQGAGSCPNCRHEEIEEMYGARDPSSRIAAARRRKSTPEHVKRLIKKYDVTRARVRDIARELKEHRRAHRCVYACGNRIRGRLGMHRRRERMLRHSIGHMSIQGVPLVNRFRLAPPEDDGGEESDESDESEDSDDVSSHSDE